MRLRRRPRPSRHSRKRQIRNRQRTKQLSLKLLQLDGGSFGFRVPRSMPLGQRHLVDAIAINVMGCAFTSPAPSEIAAAKQLSSRDFPAAANGRHLQSARRSASWYRRFFCIRSNAPGVWYTPQSRSPDRNRLGTSMVRPVNSSCSPA